jgi:predicted GH43/DUF377 family glycosyl hydrolase
VGLRSIAVHHYAGRSPTAKARISVRRFLLYATLLFATTACGPEFLPRQARFSVFDCEAIDSSASPPMFDWEVQPQPVIARGEPGSWDALDVLNPSVVQRGETLYNLYSGFDGRAWHTGLATSTDGVFWQKEPGPVLSPDPTTWESGYIAANGAAAFDGRTFLYWYQAGARGSTRIGMARSDNARDWEKHPAPVLEAGPPGSWDEMGVGDPYVLTCGQDFYMYYLGQDRRGLQRLGLARSPDGVHWQKSHLNPLLDVGPPGSFEEMGLGEPAVFRWGQRYYMLYTGRDSKEHRRVGWAESGDGVNWEKSVSQPLLAGSQPWDAAVVCDPTVWSARGRLMVWFGGGDRPSPDENLHGQIGLAYLTPQGNLR